MTYPKTVGASALALALAMPVALAPMLTLLARQRVPSVIFEIMLGILIGPAVLALAHPSGFVANLGSMGLALLMFLAGLEVDLREMRGATLRRAASSWGLSPCVGGRRGSRARGTGVLATGWPDASTTRPVTADDVFCAIAGTEKSSAAASAIGGSSNGPA